MYQIFLNFINPISIWTIPKISLKLLKKQLIIRQLLFNILNSHLLILSIQHQIRLSKILISGTL